MLVLLDPQLTGLMIPRLARLNEGLSKQVAECDVIKSCKVSSAILNKSHTRL